MGSLRTFHILFVMIVFVATDLFGAWGVWYYSRHRETPALVAAIVSFMLGFGVVGYVLWMLHKLDRAKIQ